NCWRHRGGMAVSLCTLKLAVDPVYGRFEGCIPFIRQVLASGGNAYIGTDPGAPDGVSLRAEVGGNWELQCPVTSKLEPLGWQSRPHARLPEQTRSPRFLESECEDFAGGCAECIDENGDRTQKGTGLRVGNKTNPSLLHVQSAQLQCVICQQTCDGVSH